MNKIEYYATAQCLQTSAFVDPCANNIAIDESTGMYYRLYDTSSEPITDL